MMRLVGRILNYAGIVAGIVSAAIAWLALSGDTPRYELSYVREAQDLELPVTWPFPIAVSGRALSPNEDVSLVKTKVWATGNQAIDTAVFGGELKVEYPGASRVLAARISQDTTLGNLKAISCVGASCSITVNRLVKNMGFEIESAVAYPGRHGNPILGHVGLDNPHVEPDVAVDVENNSIIKTFERQVYHKRGDLNLWIGLLFPASVWVATFVLVLVYVSGNRKPALDTELAQLGFWDTIDAFAPSLPMGAIGRVLGRVFGLTVFVTGVVVGVIVPLLSAYVLFFTPRPPI